MMVLKQTIWVIVMTDWTLPSCSEEQKQHVNYEQKQFSHDRLTMWSVTLNLITNRKYSWSTLLVNVKSLMYYWSYYKWFTAEVCVRYLH